MPPLNPGRFSGSYRTCNVVVGSVLGRSRDVIDMKSCKFTPAPSTTKPVVTIPKDATISPSIIVSTGYPSFDIEARLVVTKDRNGLLTATLQARGGHKNGDGGGTTISYKYEAALASGKTFISQFVSKPLGDQSEFTTLYRSLSVKSISSQ